MGTAETKAIVEQRAEAAVDVLIKEPLVAIAIFEKLARYLADYSDDIEGIERLMLETEEDDDEEDIATNMVCPWCYGDINTENGQLVASRFSLTTGSFQQFDDGEKDIDIQVEDVSHDELETYKYTHAKCGMPVRLPKGWTEYKYS